MRRCYQNLPFARSRHIAKAAADVDDVKTILDAHEAAVVLVAAGGRLTFVNAAGRAMLDAGDVVMERNGGFAMRNLTPKRLVNQGIRP